MAIKNTGQLADITQDINGTDDIILWGDSMTAPASGYGDIFAPITSKVVRNAGVGGESSIGVCARQGAIPFMLLPDGNVIPASGGVPVTIVEPVSTYPMLQGDGIPDGIVVGTLAGVEGTLSLAKVGEPWAHDAGDVYTFTRTVNGDAVSVPRATPFITNFSELRRKDIAVIWIGRNNLTAKDRIIADIKAMVKHMSASNPRFIIMGVTTAKREVTASTNYVAIRALNDALYLEYGKRFIDVHTHLTTYGLLDAGIPATTADTADISLGVVPISLRVDTVHLNTAGKTVVANLVAERLKELGWTSVNYATYPTPPVTHTNIIKNPEFETDVLYCAAAGGASISRDVTDSNAGNACLKLVNVESASSAVNFHVDTSLGKFPIAAGQKINMSARIKAVAGVSINFLAHQWSEADAYLGAAVVMGGVSTGDWKHYYVYEGVPHVDARKFLIQVTKYSTSSASTETFYIDSVDVWLT